MTQENFKYHYEGKGYKNKRDLSHGITESYLSEYGIQMKEQVYQEALSKVMSNLDITEREASRKIFLGYTHNDAKTPNPHLSEVVETLREGNYLYMTAYSFGAGGSIITHVKEKMNEKFIKGGAIKESVPIELDDDSQQPKEEKESVPSLSEPNDGLKGISEDFRARD